MLSDQFPKSICEVIGATNHGSVFMKIGGIEPTGPVGSSEAGALLRVPGCRLLGKIRGHSWSWQSSSKSLGEWTKGSRKTGSNNTGKERTTVILKS